jgi:ATP-binding cassette, subfamily B, bacterial MsbA
MNTLKEIYRYTFLYKRDALLTIFFNFLFVLFNLISLALFVPFMELIFKTELPEVAPVMPQQTDGLFNFLSDYYQYTMQHYLFTHGKEKALVFICVSVLLAFFLKNLFRYLAIYFQSELRMAVVRDLRDKLFAKTLRLPMAFYSEEKKGDLMARMSNDVQEIEVSVVSVLQLIFRDPIDVVLTISLLLYWSPQLTLISFVVMPLSALVISRIGKSLKRTAREGQDQMGRVFSIIEETLGGIRIIKAFTASEQVQAKFNKENLKHQQLVTSTFRKRDLSSPLNEFLGAAVMLVIVYFGGKLVLSEATGSLTGEQFMGFIIVFSQLLRPIQNIAQNVSNLQKAKVSLDRINEILHTDEVILDPENPVQFSGVQTQITYENVCFSYGENQVLNHINLTIPKGKTIALVGESGSGKSTISDLLPRFYDVTSGRIAIDGVDIRQFRVEELRGEIGIVSQESILFNDSIRNNIAFGKPGATEEEIMHAAKIANAHEFILAQEQGYDTNIGERGNKLSGGQKQRISIARAILKDPQILILDEATSALDTESEKLVQDALEKLMANRTSIVIAHRLSTIRKADEIVVLQKGEVVERGAHEQLMQQNGLYYKLSTLQGIAP